MKITELRKLTKKQLDDKLNESKLELMKLNAKKALKTIEKPSQVGNTRKLIARIKTLLKEKFIKASKKDALTASKTRGKVKSPTAKKQSKKVKKAPKVSKKTIKKKISKGPKKVIKKKVSKAKKAIKKVVSAKVAPKKPKAKANKSAKPKKK